MKMISRLFTIAVMVASLVGALTVPATTYAGSHVGPTQCADTKVNCQKKGSGQGSQTTQNTTTSTPAQDQACQGFSQVSGVSCSENNAGSDAQNQLGSVVNTVVTFLGYLAGILGIIFILFSGFRYITSNGDQNKVASAKTTLIYALIGLAILAICQILIGTVLATASNV